MKKILWGLLALSFVTLGWVDTRAQTLQPPEPPAYGVLGGALPPMAVTSSSSRVTLPVGLPYGAITIYNPGTVDAYVALGGSLVVATSSGACTITGGPGPSCIIPAGRTLVFWANSATNLAAITASSSTTLDIFMGNGPVAMGSGGGSTGGGSGITALTGDVTAAGTGSVTATAVSFNGGTPFGSAAGFASSAFSPANATNTITASGTTNVSAGQWTAGNTFNVTGSGVTLQLPVSTSVTSNSTMVVVTGANSVTLTPNAGDAINGGTAGASVTIAAKSNVFLATNATGAITVGGYSSGGGVPCTTTALSLQYNNAGAFGCVANWTSDATNLILSGAVNGDLATYNSSHALVDSGTLLSSLAPLAGTNTFSSNNTFSQNGALSSGTGPAFNWTGTVITGGTGTTTVPLIYYNCTASTQPTTWSTSGTIWGENSCTSFAGNFLDFHLNGGTTVFSVNTSGIIVTSGNLQLSNNTAGIKFRNGNTTLNSNNSAQLTSGAADAAAPVAQSFNVQSVVTGTSNTAGALWTFTDSAGTGTSASGGILWQNHPAGGTGSTPNAAATAMQLNNGLQVGSPTGGFEGTGTINAAGAYYANGTVGVTSATCTQWTNGICTHT